MTGSAKQIAWAESILADGRATIAGNIERNRKFFEEYGDKMYEEHVKVWEQIGVEFDKIVAKVTDASAIINKRNQLSPNALCRAFDQMMAHR